MGLWPCSQQLAAEVGVTSMERSLARIQATNSSGGKSFCQAGWWERESKVEVCLGWEGGFKKL